MCRLVSAGILPERERGVKTDSLSFVMTNEKARQISWWDGIVWRQEDKGKRTRGFWDVGPERTVVEYILQILAMLYAFVLPFLIPTEIIFEKMHPLFVFLLWGVPPLLMVLGLSYRDKRHSKRVLKRGQKAVF